MNETLRRMKLAARRLKEALEFAEDDPSYSLAFYDELAHVLNVLGDLIEEVEEVCN